MENLKAVFTQIIEQAKPYTITAGASFVAGFLVHWIIF
jgi:hypothetical protein